MAARSVRTAVVQYNWHPAVHKHFDEKLYFIMIRLREPLHRPVAHQIRGLLEAANIEYACEYSIFGWWDALIRVWLNPVSHDRLLRVLDPPTSENNIDRMLHFTATDIRYLWTGSEKNLIVRDKDILEQITTHTEDIDFTATNFSHTEAKRWDALREAGLLIERNTPEAGGVKFYMALDQTDASKMSPEEEIRAILNALKSSGMSKLSSLYVGDGRLADYLVRSVARTYGDVLKLAASFDEHLHDTRLRPMTLLIANTDAQESDQINSTKPISHIDDNILELLGLDDPACLEALAVADRMALHELMVQMYELATADGPLRTILREILVAAIRDDPSDRREFQKALSFMLEFEVYLTEYIDQLLSDTYGKGKWLPRLRETCRESTIQKWKNHAKEMDKDVAKWSLGTFIHTAQAASKFAPYFAKQATQTLGRNWSGRAFAVLDLRNDVAHGRLHKIKYLNRFSDPFVSAFLRELIDAAEFWSLCFLATEKGA